MQSLHRLGHGRRTLPEAKDDLLGKAGTKETGMAEGIDAGAGGFLLGGGIAGIVRDRRLDDGAVRMWLFLMTQGGGGPVQAGARVLGQALGASCRTAQRRREALRAAGLLRIEEAWDEGGKRLPAVLVPLVPRARPVSIVAMGEEAAAPGPENGWNGA